MTMTDRERLKTLRKSRKPEDLEPIISRYLPLVSATAASQVDDEQGIRTVTESVFQTFAYRIRRISKKTYLPAWFVRTATYASTHWNTKNGPEAPSPSRMAFLSLADLSIKYGNALVANAIHQRALPAIAEALGQGERKIRKQIAKGQHKLRKRARKRGLPAEAAEAPLCFDCLRNPTSAPNDWDTTTLATQSLARKNLSATVKQALRSWLWIDWKRRFKFLGAAAGSFVLLIAALAATAAIAWETGHLMAWMIKLGAKQALAQAPELGEPPRAWPHAGMQTSALQRRADLFGPTNIWKVEFTFTPEQWNGITPKKVKPVKLFGDDGNIVLRNPHAKRSGLAGVLGIEFEWTQADLIFGGQSFTNISTRYRGNGTYVNSLYARKQSIKIDLNKSHPDQKIHGIDKLNFNNLVEDSSFMHDALGYALFRASGIVAPRTAYAWLVITITGQEENRDNGFYLMLENVDQRFAKDRFGTRKIPIFKPVTPYLFSDLGDDWESYDPIYDLKTEATEEQKQRIIDFAKSLTHDNDEVFAQRVDSFMDLDHFSRYLASIVLIASYDGFLTNGQNFYLYLAPDTDLICFIPWDLDHGWGDFPFVGSASDRDQASIWHPWVGKHRLLERLMKVEAFRALYRQQLENLLETEFNPNVLGPRIDAIAAGIQEAVEYDNPFRFRRFLKTVGNDWGDPPPTVETMIRPVNPIKRFITARSQSVRAQLDGKSEGVIPALSMGPPKPEED